MPPLSHQSEEFLSSVGSSKVGDDKSSTQSIVQFGTSISCALVAGIKTPINIKTIRIILLFIFFTPQIAGILPSLLALATFYDGMQVGNRCY